MTVNADANPTVAIIVRLVVSLALLTYAWVGADPGASPVIVGAIAGYWLREGKGRPSAASRWGGGSTVTNRGHQGPDRATREPGSDRGPDRPRPRRLQPGAGGDGRAVAPEQGVQRRRPQPPAGTPRRRSSTPAPAPVARPAPASATPTGVQTGGWLTPTSGSGLLSYGPRGPHHPPRHRPRRTHGHARARPSRADGSPTPGPRGTAGIAVEDFDDDQAVPRYPSSSPPPFLRPPHPRCWSRPSSLLAS